MESTGKIFSFTVLILFVHTVFAITPTKYMTMYCHKSIFVNSSLILELTNELLEVEPENPIHCSTKLVAGPGLKLLLHFITLDISLHHLSPDGLHIYDYIKTGEARQVSPPGGLYGIYDQYYTHTSSGVEDYLSSSNMTKLEYMGKPSFLYRGFRMLITTVKDPNSDGKCGIQYTRCSKGSICIPTCTLCNGDNNCGTKDDSDERNCNWVLSTGLEEKYAISNAVISGVLSCLSFIVVVILVFGLIFRYNRRNYLRRQTIQVCAKRNPDGKWKITNDMGLTAHIYAPPTYDDVVADENSEEPPPAYESLPCSVRNSCELQTSQNGSVTIVCIPNRDIHLYNEGGNVQNVQCYMVDADDDSNTEETTTRNTNERTSNVPTSSSGVSLTLSSARSSGNIESLSDESDSEYTSESGITGSHQSSPKSKLLPTKKTTDSNENLIHPKQIGIKDDEIEYMDDDE